jgi:hypothetical protein
MTMNDRQWNEWWTAFGDGDVKGLLALYWDPIGLYGDSGSVGEYDDYAEALGPILRDGGSVDDVRAFLASVARNDIGLTGPDERADEASARLVTWYSEATKRAASCLGRRDSSPLLVLCSGAVLSAAKLPGGHSAVPLDAGMAYIPSPPSGARSEAGLDNIDWAERIANNVDGGVRVIYVESEFRHGTGSQAAVGWLDGTVCFGPVRTQSREDRAGFAVVRQEDETATNAALRWLGVTRTELRDEFHTVGLARLPRS